MFFLVGFGGFFVFWFFGDFVGGFVFVCFVYGGFFCCCCLVLVWGFFLLFHCCCWGFVVLFGFLKTFSANAKGMYH